MKKLKITSILILSLILLIGCVNNQEPVVNEEQSKIEYTYNTTTINTIENEDVKKWYETNAKNYGTYIYEIDEKIQYLLIAAGERRTGGYSLEIDDVTLENSELTFDILLNEPGEDDTVTQALTYPDLLVKVETNEAVDLKANLNFDKSENENSEADQSEEIMQDYKTTKFENVDELKSFVDSTIDQVDQEAADRLVIDLLDRIKMDDFPAFNEYLMSSEGVNPNIEIQQIIEVNKSEFNNQWRIFSEDKDILMNKIENQTLKENLKKYFDRYLGLSSQEGSLYAVVDYYELKNEYGQYLSDGFNQYNDFLIEQIEQPLASDGHLNLTVDELVDRITKYEIYMKENSDFEFVGNFKNFYMTGIYKLVNPSPAENTLTENYKPTEALMDGYNELKNNEALEVTKIAVNDMLEFINSKPDQVLGSYQNTQELNQNANEIHQKIMKLIDDQYLRQYDDKTKETILNKSEKVLTLLENKNYSELASYVHPEKGVRFSPYTYVDLNNDVVLTRNDLNAVNIGEKEYIWGKTDGKGDDIDLSVDEYFDRYVYEKNYLSADEVTINHKFQRGNSLNNVFSIYPQDMIVEYYLPGSAEYSGMDWGSIKLVFEEYNNEYYLKAIVHSEWTI